MTDANPEDIIKNARDKKGLTQQQVADFLGIGLRSYQHFEAGRFPAFKTAPIIALEKHLGIKIYDKIYGDKKVSHETATDEPDAQFNIPKGITFIETKDGANEYLRKRRELKNHSGPYMVPLVPVAAQAGYAKNFYDMAYIEKLESYPILPGVDPHGASWRYFQVKGRSMEDTLMEDQFILTSQVIKEDWRNIEHTYIYVIVTDEGVVVKRLYKVKGKDYWAAISDNPDEATYPQFRIYVNDVKELWKFRRKVDWYAPAPRKVEVKV